MGQAVKAINSLGEHVYTLGSGASLLDTFKVLALLYVVAKLGAFFHVFTLIYLSVLGAFGGPKVYNLYQPEIDSCIAIAKDKIFDLKRVAEETLDSIPKAKKAA